MEDDEASSLEAPADSAPSSEAEAAASGNGKKPRRRRAKPKAEEASSTIQTITSKDKLMHICDFTACRLPAEDCYVHSKAPRT